MWPRRSSRASTLPSPPAPGRRRRCYVSMSSGFGGEASRVEGSRFHALEQAAGLGAFGAAGVERVHEGTGGSTKGFQCLVKITCIGCGPPHAVSLRSAGREVAEE